MNLKNDPDVGKDIEFICNENGFALEKHQVVTSDGYILEVYRIPGTLGNHQL